MSLCMSWFSDDFPNLDFVPLSAVFYLAQVFMRKPRTNKSTGVILLLDQLMSPFSWGD
jgi:hypothetical protein